MAAQDRRRAVRVRSHRQDAALAQQAAPVPLWFKVHAAKPAPINIGDPIVASQPFVEERVIRRQQIEHAAIRAQDAVDEELAFPLE